MVSLGRVKVWSRREDRSGYNGGIWQVDAIGFKDTQNTNSHPGLRKTYDSIQRDLRIDWTKARYMVGLAHTTVFWDSAIAARLFYHN